MLRTLILLFVGGTILGSFGSVIMARLAHKIDMHTLRSIAIGRSQCPECQTTLQPQHLVPILSYLFQKGKCHHCNAKISPMYPILEILSGVVFVATFLLLQNEPTQIIIFWTAINWLFVMLIIHDQKTMELHVPIWFLILIVALAPQVANMFGDFKIAILNSILWGGVFYLFYFGAKLYVRLKYKKKEEGMGEGDAMIAAGLGLLAPFVFQYNGLEVSLLNSIELLLIFIILSSVIGLLRASVTSIFGNKQDGPAKIPFIPSMIFGFWLLLIFGKLFISIVFGW